LWARCCWWRARTACGLTRPAEHRHDGQGEPLLNLANVVKAARILLDPGGFALSPRRITVSTAGIVPAIAKLGREPVRPKLQSR